MAGNDKFRRDIKRFISKSNVTLDKFARAVVIEIYSRVVLKSPVDSGRLIQNWNISPFNADSSTNENENKDRGAAIARGERALQSIAINGQTIYITNSLPYAYRIEYEGWSKIKSPAGMVRTTLAELSGILQGAAMEVKQ